jgi:hypothetical protein
MSSAAAVPVTGRSAGLVEAPARACAIEPCAGVAVACSGCVFASSSPLITGSCGWGGVGAVTAFGGASGLAAGAVDGLAGLEDGFGVVVDDELGVALDPGELGVPLELGELEPPPGALCLGLPPPACVAGPLGGLPTTM